LLKLDGRRGWHFPQTPEGVYAGCNPSGSLSAIAHLEALRLRGADFLLLPSTAFWWLEHYRGLDTHLRHRYREALREEACLGVAPREPAVTAGPAGPTFADVLEECHTRLGYLPAVLDWGTDTALAAALPQHAVFSPPGDGDTLPYLDQSVDVVAIPPTPGLVAEARRVAKAAVLTVGPPAAGNGVQVEWRLPPP